MGITRSTLSQTEMHGLDNYFKGSLSPENLPKPKVQMELIWVSLVSDGHDGVHASKTCQSQIQ